MEVKGFPAEPGLYRALTKVLPPGRLGVHGTDRRMMGHLLDQVSIPFIRSSVLKGLAQQGVERLGHASNTRRESRCSKPSHVNHALGATRLLNRHVEEVGILHIFCKPLQQ